MKHRKDVSDIMKFKYLLLALECYDPNIKYKPRVSLVKLACQCSSNPKLKPEDFEKLLNTKVSDLLLSTLKEWGVNEVK